MAAPNQLSPDFKERVARSKTFRIDISFEDKSNEPNVTLGHLAYLLSSMEKSFQAGQEKVKFPLSNSFTLLDGARSKLDVRGASLPLVVGLFSLQDAQEQLSRTIGPIAYVNSRLYPDDVVSILKTSRSFLARYYRSQEQSFSWSYQLTSISNQLREAQNDLDDRRLTNIVLGDLKNAVSETAQVVKTLHESFQKEQVAETEPIEPLLNKVITSPIQTWKEQLKEIATALANTNLGDQVVITANHSYTSQDVCRLLNHLFNTIRDQLRTSAENEKDNRWKKLSDQLKLKFLEQGDQYLFSASELGEKTVRASDRARAQRLIDLFDDLVEALAAKEEKKTEEVEEEKEEEDTEGGEEEEQPQQPSILTQNEIRQQIFEYLKEDSWEDFLAYFSNLSLKPQTFPDKKKAYLRDLYQDLTSSLLNQYGVQQQLAKQINNWLKETYRVDVKQKEQTYSFGPAQRDELQANIAKFFFATYNQQFIAIIKETAELPEAAVTPTEEKELDRLEGEDHLTKIVLPPTPDLEKVAESADPSQVAERGRFVAEATTAFIGLYFPELDLNQQEEAQLRRLIATALNQQLANIPSEKLAVGSARGIILNRIFPKIFLDADFNREFFVISQRVYNRQLQSLDLSTEAEMLNIYNTVDSLIVLLDDPESLIERLSDKELKINFNLPDDFSDYQQLRKILRGLIRLRQARQVYHQRLKITPLLIGEKGSNRFYKNQKAYLIPTRVLVKEAGPEAVAFLQDQKAIKQAKIDETQKEELYEWRELLWRETVVNLEQETIVKVYRQYGITIEEINWEVLPAPDNFSYIELAQLAGADAKTLSPEQAQLAAFANNILGQAEPDQDLNTRLSRMLGKKGTKALLTAVAPEAIPVLNTLEKLPIIGEQIEKKYEEIGKLMELAGLAGAGLIAFLTWLFRGVSAAIGAVIGGVVGGIIGSFIPAIGTAIGALLGGTLGGIIGNWIGQAGGISEALGIGGGTSAASTTATSSGAGATQAATAAAARGGGALAGAANSAGGILAATGATVAVGYGVISQINSGTQIRPMSDITRQEDMPGGTFNPGTGEESIFVDIEKTPTPKEVDDAPVTVTYKITIQPKGYDLIITDAKDEVEVFMEEEFTGNAPVLGLADFPDLEEGQVIDAASGFEFEYEQTYNRDFQDSMVANTFTLSFDYCLAESGEEEFPSPSPSPTPSPTDEPDDPDEPYECETVGGSAEAATIASVIIGDAPTAKEGCWPAAGTLTQMPFETYSHCSKERPWGKDKPCIPGTYDDAVDIGNNLGTPVCSPFNGKVSKVDTSGSSTYGLQVEVTAGGAVYKFAHLSAAAVSPGQNVTPGTLLGSMGATGGNWGVHLHYSRANNATGRFYSYGANANSILMTQHQGEPATNSCCIFGEFSQ